MSIFFKSHFVVLTVVGLLFISYPCFSSEKKIEQTKTGKRIVKIDDNDVVKDSSEANRDSKQMLFSIGGGFMPYPVGTLAIGIFITPNDLLEIGYSRYNADVGSLEDSTRLYHLSYRRFIGNSFNLSFGGFYADHTYGYKIFGLFPEEEGGTPDDFADGYLKGVSGEFRLGNMWQWKYFTIGCDWIGVHQILSLSEKRAKPNAEKKAYQEVNDSISRDKKPRVELMRFFIGVAF